MKNLNLNKILSALFAVFALAFAAMAQAAYRVGDKVEVEYSKNWYQAKILEVKGDSYKIHYDKFSSSWDEIVPVSRIRRIAGETIAPNRSNEGSNAKTESDEPDAGALLVYGKYGCISTTGSAALGTYQIHPRGSFVISKNGKYVYNGYEKPSPGDFTVDAKNVLHFTKGALDGGEATPLGEGYANQFFLVYPTITDNRWKCKLIDE